MFAPRAPESAATGALQNLCVILAIPSRRRDGSLARKYSLTARAFSASPRLIAELRISASLWTKA